MLVPAVATLLVLGQAIRDPNRLYLPQLFPKRSETNGYADYIAGVDLMNAVGKPDRSNDQTLTHAALLRKERQRVGLHLTAIEMVRRGNRKTVFDPRKRSGGLTLYPELTDFKDLAWLLAAKADMEFSDGLDADGVETLLEEMTFGRKVQDSKVLIGFLAGNVIQSIGLKRLNGRQRQIPAADVKRLEAFSADAIKDARVRLESCIQFDLSEQDSLAKAFLANQIPSQLQGIPEVDSVGRALGYFSKMNYGAVDDPRVDPDGKLADTLQSLTAKQRTDHLKNAQKYKGSYLSWLHRILSGPESHWDDAAPSSKDLVVRKLYGMGSSQDSQVRATAARLRTQYRLLLIAHRVVAFQKEHRRLPVSLASLHLGLMLSDPLSGRHFVYEKTATGFQVYSLGNARSGTVSLGKIAREAPHVSSR